MHRPLVRFSRAAALAATALAASLSAAACTPISMAQGYQVVDERPAEVKVGDDNMATVRTRFGSPTIVSTFEPNIWFYMNQISDQFGFYRPRVRSRDIVAITFDKQTEKVAAVNTYTVENGRIIAFNNRETPTRGRELNALEQIIGTLGNKPMLPPEDDPGDPTRGGQR